MIKTKLKDICDSLSIVFIEDDVTKKVIYIGKNSIVIKGKASDFQKSSAEANALEA